MKQLAAAIRKRKESCEDQSLGDAGRREETEAVRPARAKEGGLREKILQECRMIPGFRSSRTLVKTLACIGYLLLIAVVFQMEVTRSDGAAAGTTEVVANRIAMLVLLLGEVFYLGNYKGWRAVFPFRRHGVLPVEIGRILLGAGIIFLVPILVLIILFP